MTQTHKVYSKYLSLPLGGEKLTSHFVGEKDGTPQTQTAPLCCLIFPDKCENSRKTDNSERGGERGERERDRERETETERGERETERERDRERETERQREGRERERREREGGIM